MISEIKEVFDKINRDRYVIGLDINDSFAQVSVCKVDSDNPTTISVSEDTDEFNVELYMLKRRTDGVWLFGKEAKEAEEDGVLVSNLFERARLKKTVRIDREEYLAKDIFLLFLKKVLLMFPGMMTPDKIISITITLKDADSDTIMMLQELPSMLKVNPEILHFITYEESFYYYMLYQPGELQNHNILLYDSSGEKLRSYSLMRNYFKTPGVATVDVKEYINFSTESPAEYDRREKDALFLRISTEICNSTVYSGVYLIGNLFYSEWSSESLQYLCKGRKVFKGNNLFSKGACYAAKEKHNPSGREDKIKYLGNDRLKVTIGVETDDELKEQIPLIEAGSQWFESIGKCELILKETDKINIYLSYVYNNVFTKGEITLPGLITSSNRITRVSIEVKMTNENTVLFKVWDMGFGELFPSTGKDWEQELKLEG